MIHRALITAMYPLHDLEALKRLSTKWYYSKEQPIGMTRRATRALGQGRAGQGRAGQGLKVWGTHGFFVECKREMEVTRKALASPVFPSDTSLLQS